MKLSKTLLQSIAVGVTMGAAVTACSVPEDDIRLDICDETCQAGCDIDHDKSGGDPHWEDCPACGLG